MNRIVNCDKKWKNFFKDETVSLLKKGSVTTIVTYPGCPAFDYWRDLIGDVDVEVVQELDLEMLDRLSVKILKQNFDSWTLNPVENGLIVMFGSERIVQDGKLSVMKWLDQQVRTTKRGLVLFYEGNLFGSSSLRILSRVPTWKSLIAVIPVLEEVDISCLVEGVGECGDDFWELAMEMSGGIISIIEMIVWLVRDVGVDIDRLWERKEVDLVIGEVWNGLGVKEKELLVKLSMNAEFLIVDYEAELNYLDLIGFIKRMGQSWVIKSSLLEMYIHKHILGMNDLIIRGDGNIFLKGQKITKLFSMSELNLLRLLMNRRGKLVSRDEISELWWSDQDWSDWALDARISRLRKKLRRIGLSEHLQVKRGRGLVYF